MKEKQLACIVLGMAIFACFFGIMKMQTKLQDARKRADSAKTTSENTNRQRVVSSANFADLQRKSEAEIAYYELWKPEFGQFPTGERVTDFVLKHMKEKGVDPFSQGMNPVAYKDKHGIISKLQRVNLTCVGDYDTVFNWLGDLEVEIATSRVTSCEVTKAQGEADIRMVLTIDVPVMNEDEGEATS